MNKIQGTPAVAEMFRSASRNGLRYPSIRLESGYSIGLGAAGDVLWISHRPGGVREALVKVNLDGSIGWIRQSDAAAQAVEQFRQFAANPREAAIRHGRLTGACCFCSRQLTDGRSVRAGYGPICADKFGLAWGDHNETAALAVAA